MDNNKNVSESPESRGDGSVKQEELDDLLAPPDSHVTTIGEPINPILLKSGGSTSKEGYRKFVEDFVKVLNDALRLLNDCSRNLPTQADEMENKRKLYIMIGEEVYHEFQGSLKKSSNPAYQELIRKKQLQFKEKAAEPRRRLQI